MKKLFICFDTSLLRASMLVLWTLGVIGLPAYSQADENAVEQSDEVQDMSDPLAVFTQAGVGLTNKGLNIKIGQSYDTGSDTTMGMNVLELKGALGDSLGWDGGSRRDDSLDSFRFRNFEVDLTNGRGTQIDMSYAFDENPLAEETANISYSILQALPKMGRLNLYPLAGVGVAVGNNALEDDGSIDSGYSIMGTFVSIGMFSKLAITDKLWINYNPFWLSTLSGSDLYKDNAYGLEEDSLLTHEFAVSYQFNPRFNVRYFANWTENVDINDGDHRVEFNYQL